LRALPSLKCTCGCCPCKALPFGSSFGISTLDIPLGACPLITERLATLAFLKATTVTNPNAACPSSKLLDGKLIQLSQVG